MSPASDPRLAAPSLGHAGEHISSFNLLVAGVKGPLYLRGEKQMNPGLKQATCFLFFLPRLRFKGFLLCLLILSCEWERAIRAGEMVQEWGKKSPSHWCVKREGSAGIRNVNFMGST